MGRNLLPEVVKEKSYQPNKWTGAHRRMVALEIAGYKPGEIAEMTGNTPSRVSIILNDARADVDRKEFAKKIVEDVADIQLKIALHAEEAFDEVVDELRNAEDPKIRQRAAFDILDRAGYSPVRKEARVSETRIPAELAGRMEKALEAMEAVDAKYEVVA